MGSEKVRNSSLGELLLALQEGFCSMQLISYTYGHLRTSKPASLVVLLLP
jgi:hypothetical protein